jgi:cytidylate kinase
VRVNEHTRYVARLPAVRAALVQRQREIGAQLGSLVTEGRDQGSVAFPDADAKFFVDASLEKRAERRLHDLLSDGEETTYAAVLENLRTRDETDARRAVGPLREPENAIRIDTTNVPLSEVLDSMLAELGRRGLISAARLAEVRQAAEGGS